MLTTIGNKVTSCRMSNYTCGYSNTDGNCSSTSNAHHNVALVCMTVVNRPDDDSQKIELAGACNEVDIAALSGRLSAFLNSDQFQAINDLILQWKTDGALPPVNICGVTHEDFDENLVPFCRNCDSGAEITSTGYADPDQFASNISFECISDPSILDTIVDLLEETGLDLLGSLGNISETLKPLLTKGLLFVGLLLLIWFAIKLLSGHHKDNQYEPNAPPYPQQPPSNPQYYR